jgi:predicted nucleic acid-binding protein
MAVTLKVVDASALACVCFEEPEMLAIVRELTGSALFAPAIPACEMGNICWKRIRRTPELSAAILQEFAARKGFPVTIRNVVLDGLARTLHAELVTVD